MDPLNSSQIRGNWATLLLPIREDDAIDYELLAAEIDILIGCQVSGIYSNGTAGEFHNQTEDEFDAINGLLAERCNRAGMPFQIGVSHMSPMLSLRRLQRAVALRPSALQVILPDWFPVTNAEAIAFLEKMAALAGGIGLVLYNPPHAKRRLSPADFGTLKRAVPALVGIKVVGGDAAWHLEMQRQAPDVSIFVAGHALASGYRLGAYGAYSNMACLHPLAAQRWYEQMLTDITGALELETRIRGFMNDHIIPFITEQGYANQAVDKLLACVGGWTQLSPRVRWPYRSIPAAEAARLRRLAVEVLPEFFPGRAS